MNQRVREAGEQAAFDAGIHDLHPELVRTLGAPALPHLVRPERAATTRIEVAYLSAASWPPSSGLTRFPPSAPAFSTTWARQSTTRSRASHAVIGADLARRYGERPEIVHAIEAHHNDVEPNSVLDVLVQAADAVSAARPGARTRVC